MTRKRDSAPTTTMESDTPSRLQRQYGCGPVQFTGTADALYERHLIFDNVIKPATAGPRAIRGRRPLGAGRPLAALGAHRGNLRAREPQARLLPLDGVPHRPLAGQQCDEPPARSLCREPSSEKNVDWLGLLEQEPDAGLGNGGLGRLAACFIDSMATLQLPAMGYGLRYEYGIFRQTIQDGWQQRTARQLAAARPDPWEVARPREQVEVQLELLVRGARRQLARRPGPALHPARHPVRPPGRRLRRQDDQHAAALGGGRAGYFDFQEFSSGDFVGAVAERSRPNRSTRVLYPDDSTSMGQGLRFVQEYFLVACSLADLVRRFRREQRRLERAARQGRHPAQRHAPVAGRRRIDAHPARRGASGLGPGLGPHAADLAYTNHTLLPEALEKWPRRLVRDVLPRHLEIIFEINRRLLDTVRARFPG